MPLPENVSRLFDQALAIRDDEQREKFLEKECVGDKQLKRDIEKMIRLHKAASGFLSKSPGITAPHNTRLSVGRASVVRHLSQQFSPPNDEQSAGSELPSSNSLGRYQLQGEIARGGMGAILKGRDVDLGRSLAIKVLLESHATNPAVTERFIEEAQIGGQLQHPGIAPVYELGQMPDERPFFAMKLVKGETLAALLAEKDSSPKNHGRLLDIFEQVCQTLAYAHSRRVIHRDLKPANIMVGAFGEVQVMDWGLAKVLKVGGLADEKRARDTKLGHSLIQTVRSDSNLPQASVGTKESHGSSAAETQAGSVMGTPAYMPPEQALGEVDRLDERCDVFGLGAILCEILTGTPPYVADDTQELFRQAARGKLDECYARLDACDADSQLIALTKHCLAPELEDRLRNAGELSDRLTEYLESVETRLRETEVERAAEATRALEQRKRRRVSTALATSLVFLAATCGGGWMWLQSQAAEQRESVEARLRKHVNDAELHLRLADSKNLAEKQAELNKALASAESAIRIVNQEANADGKFGKVTKLLNELRAESKDVRRQLAAQNKSQRIRDQLDFIRLGYSGYDRSFSTRSNPVVAERAARKQYIDVFKQAGIDISNLSAEEAAELVRASSVSDSLISGLDHWTSTLISPQSSIVIRAATASGQWESGITAAKRYAEAEPQNLVPYMDWAVMALMKGDHQEYRRACQACLAENRLPELQIDAERIVKICQLMPGQSGVPTRRLPLGLVLDDRDDAKVSKGFFPFLLASRALLALRKGDWSDCLEYIKQSRAHDPNWSVQAMNQALEAMCWFQMDDRKAAESAFQALNELLPEVISELDSVLGRDALIAIILRNEAADLLGLAPLTFNQWAGDQDVAEHAATLAQVTFRNKLAKIATLADSNEWRKSVRRALVAGDAQKLTTLVGGGNFAEQPSALAAWVAAELRQVEQIERATQLLRSIHAQHPNDFWVNYELGRNLSLQGESEEAIGFARAAVALRPDNYGAMWGLCLALIDAGHKNESDQVFEQLLATGEFTWLQYMKLQSDMILLGEYKKAKLVEEKQLATGEKKGLTLAVAANGLIRQERFAEALEKAEEAVAIAPDLYGANFAKSLALYRLGRLEAAAEAYRHTVKLAEESGKGRPPYNNLGLVLKAQGKLEEAAEALRKAVQNAGSKGFLPRRNLVTLLREMGRKGMLSPADRRELQQLTSQGKLDERNAIAKYRERIAYNVRDIESRLRLIEELLQAAELDEALDQAKRAVVIGRDSNVTTRVLAEVYIERNELDEAIELLRELTRQPQAYTADYFNLGRALSQKATGLELEPHQIFNTSGPRRLDIQLDAAQASLVDEAIDAFQKAYEMAEQNEDARLKNGNLITYLIQLLELRGRAVELAEYEDKFERLSLEISEEVFAKQANLGRELHSASSRAIGRQLFKLLRDGKEERALELVNEAIEENTYAADRVYLLTQKANIYRRQSKERLAVPIFQQVISEFPESGYGYAALARLYLNLDEPNKAEQVLRDAKEALLSQPAFISKAFAGIYLDLGKLPDAIEELSKAVAEDRSDGVSVRRLIDLKFEDSGDLAANKDQLRSAWSESQSSYYVGDLLALLLVLEPESENRTADLNEALALARSASEHPQRRLFAARGSGEVYSSAADSSWSFSGSNTLGIVHYRRGEFNEALKPLAEFHEAGFLEPSNWLFLAMTHQQLGNAAEAREWYAKATEYFTANQASRIENYFLAEAKELFETDAQREE
ncbi:MAG TPA: hypothetical protein DDW52_19420 [Planctomycetaceae bacterium]|nr:hypothetical protein [Planctomycetaceae bacterium]